MLAQAYSQDQVKSNLIARDQWKPFPSVEDRDGWQSLPDSIRKSTVERGEKAAEGDWPPLPAIRFLDYARDGNRSRYEALSFGRRSRVIDLVVAECVKGEGTFVDDILDGVWAICEESFWGVPAHIGVQKAGRGLPDVTEPIVDLFAAETGALLAWTDYLVGSKFEEISKLIRPRVELEIQRRILTPLLERDDFGWMGFNHPERRVNNWNPWIVSNWLATNLLIEKDADRRAAAVYKAMRTVDNFIDPYPKDGGCDEGPGYWGRAGASLYDCLEWLHSATAGAIDVYDNEVVRNIAKFIYRVQIADRWFINFADANAIVVPSPGVCYGYGKRIGDPAMMSLGAWSAKEQDIGRLGAFDSIGRRLPLLFSIQDILDADPTPPLPRDVWLNEIEVVVARDVEGSPDGLCLAAKGGHNQESHNHNDIGSFVVFNDGRPLLIDAGVETYTAKTFSSERYTIWTMRSSYHTLLPTVDGVEQRPGAAFKATDVSYEASDDTVVYSLDIAKAYAPDAGISAWKRTFAVERGKSITVTDDYRLESEPKELVCTLLTPCEVDISTKGKVTFLKRTFGAERESGEGTLEYDADALDVRLEQVPITDTRMQPVWDEALNRVVFTATSPGTAGTLVYRITP